jgi:hypothetical protein
MRWPSLPLLRARALRGRRKGSDRWDGCTDIGSVRCPRSLDVLSWVRAALAGRRETW